MKITYLVLAASIAVGGAVLAHAPTASAQTQAGAASQRRVMEEVETVGVVSRYVVSPSGAIRGVVLDANTVVFVQGRRAQTLPRRVPIGTSLRIAGFASANQPRAIHRATIRATDGTVLLQPPAQRAVIDSRENVGDVAARRAHIRSQRLARLARLPAMSAQGTVQSVVRDQRGTIDGLLLADGTSVVLSRRLAREIHGHGVRRGDVLRIAGHGGTYANGRSVFAEQVTFADGAVVSAPIASLQARR